MNESAPVFSCRMCGTCCEGVGGIVLSSSDRERLCRFLGLEEEDFLKTCTMSRNGKIHLRSTEQGRCLFYRENEGCTVHEVAPAVCQAWPFFRGNIVDATSLFLAKVDCPGIRARLSHSAFVAEGVRYLREAGLIAESPEDGRVLFSRQELEALARSLPTANQEHGKKA